MDFFQTKKNWRIFFGSFIWDIAECCEIIWGRENVKKHPKVFRFSSTYYNTKKFTSEYKILAAGIVGGRKTEHFGVFFHVFSAPNDLTTFSYVSNETPKKYTPIFFVWKKSINKNPP